MEAWKALLKRLENYKIPLLILALGVIFMLLPGGIRSPTEKTQEESSFPELISRIDGVGRSCLALSEQGVVVVCEGADEAEVRYSLLQAIRSYTGFTSERVTILKMTD